MVDILEHTARAKLLADKAKEKVAQLATHKQRKG